MKMKKNLRPHNSHFIPKILQLLLASSVLSITMAVSATDLATLEFEFQAIDLDTGFVTDRNVNVDIASTGTDVLIAYHADRIPHAVIVPAGEAVTLVVMIGTSYDNVTTSDVAELSFSAESVDHPWSASDTVLVRTDSGAVFKLGNVVESDTGVNFSYAPLQ
ncbi:MAG: hypothetical protein HRU20_18465 [Pseudomonadales bacterium]|nr:hypothetical protein [Pseudomonadales bacterium]